MRSMIVGLVCLIAPVSVLGAEGDGYFNQVAGMTARRQEINVELTALKAKTDVVQGLRNELNKLRGPDSGSRSAVAIGAPDVSGPDILTGCSNMLQYIYKTHEKLKNYVANGIANAQSAKQQLDQLAQQEPTEATKSRSLSAATKTLELAKNVCQIGKTEGSLAIALETVGRIDYSGGADKALGEKIDRYDTLLGELGTAATAAEGRFNVFEGARATVRALLDKEQPSARLTQPAIIYYKQQLDGLALGTGDRFVIGQAQILGKARQTDVAAYRAALDTQKQQHSKSSGDAMEMCDTVMEKGADAAKYADEQSTALKAWVDSLTAALVQRAFALDKWAKENNENIRAAQSKIDEANAANNPENDETVRNLNKVLADSQLIAKVIQGESTAISDAFKKLQEQKNNTGPLMMKPGFVEGEESSCN